MNESFYVVSLHEIVAGGVLVAVSLGMHGLGMISTVRFSNWFHTRFDEPPTFVRGLTALILTSWIIVAVHLAEVLVWAAFFQWKDCFPNFSTALYFSLNEYTTVGSDFDLPKDWRLLEGMIATAGLLGFAWSCGVLLTIAQNFQERALRRFGRRAGRGPASTTPAGSAPASES